jgi:hypothetical protein
LRATTLRDIVMMHINKLLIFFFGVCLTLISVAENAHFTENKGQLEKRVLYYSKVAGQNIILFKNGFAYDNYIKDGDSFRHHRVEIFFKGAESGSYFQNGEMQTFTEHFYQEFKEITNVHSYSHVLNKNIYPGIDVKYSFTPENGFKYDLIVHPGAQLNRIILKVKGAPVKVENGHLVFDLALGRLTENIPLSYFQETGEEVSVNYAQVGKNEIGFKANNLDQSKTLFIDPTPNLVWGTYWGGSGVEEILGSDVDQNGNIYSGGKGTSTSNISTSGAFQVSYVGSTDGILSKFDVNGNRIWSTYYGGSSYDDIRRVKINNNSEVICVANSLSSGMATSGSHQSTHGGNYDGMVLKFSNNGTRIWATYFGGSSIDDFYGILIDNHQNIYMSGRSSSSGLASSGAYKTGNSGGEDAILASFTDKGVFRWCTYFGGSSTDYLTRMVQHRDNNLYLCGVTLSTSGLAYNAVHQSTNAGSFDAFYVKIDTSGKVSWINYMGGAGSDEAIEMISVGDDLIFCGQTSSSAGIATTGAYKTTYGGNVDGFLYAFDTDGRRKWGSYYGGSGLDEIYVVQRFRDNLFIGGKTSSTTSIATSGAFQSTNGGNLDVLMMRLDLSGYPIWGSYYGGSGDDMVREFLVQNGALYATGYTSSATKIATTGSHQSSYGGGGDAFISRFDNLGCGANIFGKMVRQTLCAGDSNGIATVFVANNTGNPTFYWKTNPPQYNDTAFGLPAGLYEVVVSDTFGCIDSLKVLITEPAKLSAFVRENQPISCAGLKNGRLIADAVGGNAPYFFKWLTTPNVNKDTISGLSVGTYKVMVTDNNNCIDSATASITEPDTLKSSITGFNHATCFLLNNGQISVTATGGSQPYSYLWSSSPAQTTSTAYNLRAGYYEVQITDKNGCQSKSSYTITEPSPITIGLTGLNHSICYNDSLGEIFTKIWGGTPGYKIQWNSDPLLNTSNLTKLKGGTYRITVIDDNNCTETQNYIILEPDPLTIKFDTVIQPLCFESQDGSIQAKIGGGTPSYKLFWNAPPFNNVLQLSGLKAGLYSLLVKDSVGCITSDSLRLYPKDSMTIASSIVHPKCYGGNDGKVLSAVSGGTGPYKFSWGHNPGLNTPLLNNVTAGNYYLTVTDNNACSKLAQFIVLQPNPLEIKKELHQDVKCFNGSDGSISISANGGTVPLKVRWNSNPPSQNLTLNNVSAGLYSVVLTDSNGCADSMIIQIKEPTPLVGYFDSIYSPTCYALPNGTVTYKANGGVQPYLYAFDNAPLQFDSLASFVKAGWIQVKVLDANGCQIKDSTLIKQPASLNLESDVSQISCFSFLDGKILLKGRGGVQPYHFKWSHTNADTHIVYNLSQGSYAVTLTDKNNCIYRDTFQIFQPEKLVAKVDLTIPASCFNVANGMAGGSASGGNPAYDFYWKGPSNYTGNNPMGMRSGAYMMIVKDKNGCLDSSVAIIGQPDKVASSVIATQSPRCVDSSDGWAEVAPIPGVGPYTYLWSNGNTTARAENLAKGNYSVVITDKCGDTAMAYITISDPAPFIIPNISGFRASFRGNQEVYQIAEVPGWSYFWEVTNGTITSGQGTATITVLWNGPGRGNINVKVVNGIGCVDDNFYQVSLTTECMYVFPNPSNLSTLVLLPSVSPGESIQIFDARGRKVLEEPASVQNNIDVSYYARGIYFIRYKDCVIKFLKE